MRELWRGTILGGLALAALTACKEPAPNGVAGGPTAAPVKTSTAVEAARRRYGEVLGLMRLDAQDLTRAERLYGLVAPLCADRGERSAFLDAALEAASVPSDLGKIERMYALDILEHIAVACARNDLAGAQAVLGEAATRFAGEPRLPAIEARLLAAEGQLEPAMAAAERAAKAGSIGAIPLLATIQAQRAKAGVVGLPPGTLDEALKTVAIEPDGAWRLIDLTAVLSTRARLLGERALWEDGAAQRATILEARAVQARLGTQPFIEQTRQHALDVACFDAAALGEAGTDFCARAGAEHGNLGGAFLAGLGLDPTRFDLPRVTAIQALEAKIAALPAGAYVLVIARGDESELIPWGRPAATMIARLVERRPRLVVVDRSASPRASQILDRALALAKATPVVDVAAPRDILATGCVASLVAGKGATPGCPLQPPQFAALEQRAPFGLALLVGRDLDAELEDLRAHELPHVLASMRKPATERGAEVHLKNLSDAWLLAPGAAKRSGSQRPK